MYYTAVPRIPRRTERVRVSKTEKLSCLKCPGFCCKMAGLVEVSAYDIRRLAKHLALTAPEFEEKHIVEVTRRGKKHIKSEFGTCQFLSADHRCTVYELSLIHI